MQYTVGHTTSKFDRIESRKKKKSDVERYDDSSRFNKQSRSWEASMYDATVSSFATMWKGCFNKVL